MVIRVARANPKDGKRSIVGKSCRHWSKSGRSTLHPYLLEGIKVLERCDELTLSAETRELL
jgi:hypothetical protein